MIFTGIDGGFFLPPTKPARRHNRINFSETSGHFKIYSMQPDLKKIILDDGPGLSSEPMHLRVYKGILNSLTEGFFAPGEKLLPDIAFAQALEVNHLTLKKALNRLAAEGYLSRVRGRGTYVSEVIPKTRPHISGHRVTMLYDIVTEESLRSETFVSICNSVTELGLSLELVSSLSNRRLQFQQVKSLFSDADSAGCFVWPIMDMRQLQQLACARPAGYPLIFLNYKPELDIGGIDFSGYDDFGAGKMLGTQLRSQGYETCVVVHTKTSCKRPTNTNRVAGLEAGFSAKIINFHRYDEMNFAPVTEFLQSNQYRHLKKKASVFISEMDYIKMRPALEHSGWTPFVFFTGQKPTCGGVLLSSVQMGLNAVRILEARRKGDTSFVITHHVPGRLLP